MSNRADHLPDGDPCSCGKSFAKHRAYHPPIGNPCLECGLPSNKHRVQESTPRYQFVGIDGEGVGRKNHCYIFMGAASEDGLDQWRLRLKRGQQYLPTVDCFEFLLDLPPSCRLFSYSFNYDLTKILTDVDNETIFKLFRPDERRRVGRFAFLGPVPVKWKGYLLNLQGTKFTIQREEESRRVHVWDLFKFFQGKFVSALETWKVGNPEIWARMSSMKDARGEFEEELKAGRIKMSDVEGYCLEECECMGKLARSLLDAHTAAGLELKNFYGAGSSGAAMLNAMHIKEKLVAVPMAMVLPVACSFFGGRFEHNYVGKIEEPFIMKDISSAYPYQTYHLPCLEHGRWRLSKNREDIEGACALVHYGFDKTKPRNPFWGPFPFRTKEGSISFPAISGGGWVWEEEYKEGERLFPAVQFREAWVYEKRCNCKPFAEIPNYYILRIKLGKEGAGLVIKLAINSVYGKLAQSVGNAAFNNWIWASRITSGCRAQLLTGLGLFNDWSYVRMFATDSIGAMADVPFPSPRPTGTGGVIIDGVDPKPLGGWEKKEYKRGIFLARPGIYFPLNPSDKDLKEIKARGIGRGILLNHWKDIVEGFEEGGIEKVVDITEVPRFCGAKTSIHKSGQGYYSRACGGFNKGQQKPAFGQWVKRKIEMSFDPMPKRQHEALPGGFLKLREFPQWLESLPYDNALLSPEARDLKAFQDEMLEQPDNDYHEDDFFAA